MNFDARPLSKLGGSKRAEVLFDCLDDLGVSGVLQYFVRHSKGYLFCIGTIYDHDILAANFVFIEV